MLWNNLFITNIFGNCYCKCDIKLIVLQLQNSSEPGGKEVEVNLESDKYEKEDEYFRNLNLSNGDSIFAKDEIRLAQQNGIIFIGYYVLLNSY